MTSFVVETSTPASTALVRIEAEARLAAAELSEAGTPARYLRSIFVPADELCLSSLSRCAFGGFANPVAGVHRPLLVPRLGSRGSDRSGRGPRVAAARCGRRDSCIASPRDGRKTLPEADTRSAAGPTRAVLANQSDRTHQPLRRAKNRAGRREPSTNLIPGVPEEQERR